MEQEWFGGHLGFMQISQCCLFIFFCTFNMLFLITFSGYFCKCNFCCKFFHLELLLIAWTRCAGGNITFYSVCCF